MAAGTNLGIGTGEDDFDPTRRDHQDLRRQLEELEGSLREAREQAEQLRQAIETRDVISTAKGLLMAKEQLSSGDAFEVLRRASQRENIRVREIAERMVEAHDERAQRKSPPGA
jgi:AmiR/NasT family two-component response regulator